MKQLLFKVWNKNTKEFVKDSSNVVVEFDLISWANYSSVNRLENLDDLVIVKCTNIRDKNGNWIYVGDILAEEHDLDIGKHVVQELPGYFWYDEDSPFSLIMNIDVDGNNNFVEIVGNIYETPDMLDNLDHLV
jgi:uncharacterized phage protein (TIGR01671 family)